MSDALTIPADLKPADGRFGAGPSKIQTGHLDALAATGSSLMGTSHRQAPVRHVVSRVREGLAALFTMPADNLPEPDLEVDAEESGCGDLMVLLLRSIRKVPPGGVLRLTISAGVAEHRAGESTADTLVRAGQALAGARAQGHDRVVLM